MKQRCKNREEKNLLPFHIIKAASEGDVLAINTVLKHYEGYIITLSTRKMYDEGGRLHYCVDETLRRRLETKLITKILKKVKCSGYQIQYAGNKKMKKAVTKTIKKSGTVKYQAKKKGRTAEGKTCQGKP